MRTTHCIYLIDFYYKDPAQHRHAPCSSTPHIAKSLRKALKTNWPAHEAARDGRSGGCITGLFETFDMIEARGVIARPILAEFGVDGYFFRYQRHFVYWRNLSNGDIVIVTILQDRMHHIDRFREDFGL